ncbi:hypothetical protein ACTXT7_009015 [Hymenolepis weldensis]
MTKYTGSHIGLQKSLGMTTSGRGSKTPKVISKGSISRSDDAAAYKGELIPMKRPRLAINIHFMEHAT